MFLILRRLVIVKLSFTYYYQNMFKNKALQPACHWPNLWEPTATEVTESICLEDAVDLEDFPTGLSLPPSVESVLQHVFGEDTHVSHGHKILSNPLAVEDVLNR